MIIRLKSAVILEHVSAMSNCIIKDVGYALKDLQCIVGITVTAVHEILTKRLKLDKACAGWVPCLKAAQKIIRLQSAKFL